MTHTQEPWPEPELIEYDSEISWWRIPCVGDFTDKADAERARACVNACAGIADVSIVPMMVKALELIASHDPGTCGGITPRDCLDSIIETARSVLRMKGKGA